MTLPAIAEKFRDIVSDEDSRWWQINVFCAVIFVLCIVYALKAVQSGHSYYCLLAPLFYGLFWKNLNKCKNFLNSIASENSSPALAKLSSELHGLVFLVNMIILYFVIFFGRL